MYMFISANSPALLQKNKQASDWVGVRRRVHDAKEVNYILHRKFRLPRAARTSARRGRGTENSQKNSSRATRE